MVESLTNASHNETVMVGLDRMLISETSALGDVLQQFDRGEGAVVPEGWSLINDAHWSSFIHLLLAVIVAGSILPTTDTTVMKAHIGALARVRLILNWWIAGGWTVRYTGVGADSITALHLGIRAQAEQLQTKLLEIVRRQRAYEVPSPDEDGYEDGGGAEQEEEEEVVEIDFPAIVDLFFNQIASAVQ